MYLSGSKFTAIIKAKYLQVHTTCRFNSIRIPIFLQLDPCRSKKFKSNHDADSGGVNHHAMNMKWLWQSAGCIGFNDKILKLPMVFITGHVAPLQ